MKFLYWKKTVVKCRNVMMAMAAAILLLAAPSVMAAQGDQSTGHDFNHMATGFPLSGAHATADCATCHVGGTFKGTPKNCDGCHAVGRRVVATPKSSRHIVTNDPCEMCHTNTVTFLGVKFNHATVAPGSCASCHNGSVSTGRPATHNQGNKLTQSCDQCHRTTAWLPASWNHNGVTADCGTCHVTGGQASGLVPVSAIHTILPTLATVGPAPTIRTCTSCHRSFYSFAVQSYDHMGVGNCQNCHNATYAPYGIRAMAPNHIPLLTTANCISCHYSAASWSTERMSHSPVDVALTPCTTCHLGSSPYLGRMTKMNYGHQGFQAGQDCISCHAQRYDRWNQP